MIPPTLPAPGLPIGETPRPPEGDAPGCACEALPCCEPAVDAPISRTANGFVLPPGPVGDPAPGPVGEPVPGPVPRLPGAGAPPRCGFVDAPGIAWPARIGWKSSLVMGSLYFLRRNLCSTRTSRFGG